MFFHFLPIDHLSPASFASLLRLVLLTAIIAVLLGPSSLMSTENVNLQELQDTVSRLSSHKGVKSVLILNRKGDILVSSSGAVDTAQWTQKLLKTANSYLQSLAPDDEVSFLQLRSQQHREVMIAPHEGYVLAVLKN